MLNRRGTVRERRISMHPPPSGEVPPEAAYGMLLEDSRRHRLPQETQIELDSRAYSFVPEGRPLSDPRKEAIALRHLLSMTSAIPGEDHGLIGLAVSPGGGEYEIALGKEVN